MNSNKTTHSSNIQIHGTSHTHALHSLVLVLETTPKIRCFFFSAQLWTHSIILMGVLHMVCKWTIRKADNCMTDVSYQYCSCYVGFARNSYIIWHKFTSDMIVLHKKNNDKAILKWHEVFYVQLELVNVWDMPALSWTDINKLFEKAICSLASLSLPSIS